jgi:hypothetical protein
MPPFLHIEPFGLNFVCQGVWESGVCFQCQFGQVRSPSQGGSSIQGLLIVTYLPCTMSPCHHVTCLPCIMSPCHHVTMSPCHHVTCLPCTMLPCLLVTMSRVYPAPCLHVTCLPCTMSPCHHITFLPCTMSP